MMRWIDRTSVGLMAVASLAWADMPQWLLDARAREGQPGASRELATPDKQVTFRSPVPLGGKITDEGDFYFVPLQLAPGVIGGCYLYKEAIDVASSLHDMADTTFGKVIEPSQGKIEAKGVEQIDTLLVGETPVLVASWIYRANDGKEPRVGALRQYAASRRGRGIYCALNELGYVHTMDKVVQALVESASPTHDFNEPYFRQVMLVDFGPVHGAYSTLELARDADGDIKMRENTAILVPAADGSLQASDAIQVEWAHPDGTYINGSLVAVHASELDVNLQLKPRDPAGWAVSGDFKGKAISVSLDDPGPTSWLGQQRLLQSLLSGTDPAGKTAHYPEWSSLDPGKLMGVDVAIGKPLGDGTWSVKWAMPEAASGYLMDGVVDGRTGLQVSGTMEMGPLQIRLKRAYVRGTP